MSNDAVIEHLQSAQTVAIITTRPDGTEVATPIWAVTVDGAGYLRSYLGPRAGWYLRALSGRPTSFSLADGRVAERDPDAALATPRSVVTVTPIANEDPVQEAVDAALRTKYARQGASLTSMIVSPATECTVRIDPA
jgi:hypothetical protein